MSVDRPRDPLTSHDQANCAEVRGLTTFGVAAVVCLCVMSFPIGGCVVKSKQLHEETKQSYYQAVSRGETPVVPPTDLK